MREKKEKKGVLNVGDLGKILFGTLDNDDAEYYNEQIREFEQNYEGVVETN
jgi:hypothetical protein